MNKAILFAAIGAAAITPASAADRYLQVHGGVFQQTSETVAFASDQFVTEAIGQDFDTEADLGFAAGALLGAYVAPFVALEAEFTARTASVEQADDVSLQNLGAAFEDDLTTYAFMANAVVRPDLPIPFLPNPYAGMGIGYVTSNLQDFEGDDVGGAFAWQVKAGVSFDLLPTPGQLGLEASYFAASDFEIEGLAAADVPSADYGYGGFTGLVTWRVGF